MSSNGDSEPVGTYGNARRRPVTLLPGRQVDRRGLFYRAAVRTLVRFVFLLCTCLVYTPWSNTSLLSTITVFLYRYPFIRSSVVLDLTHIPFGGSIGAKDLEPYKSLIVASGNGDNAGGGPRIPLFRTRNSDLAPTAKFCKSFVYLADSGMLRPSLSGPCTRLHACDTSMSLLLRLVSRV